MCFSKMNICVMKIIFIFFLLLCSLVTVSSQSVLIETELFETKGGWSIDSQFIDQMGSPYLLAHGLGEVRFPETGVYYIWVRTKDWAPYPKGPGRFRMIIDGKELDHTFGASGDIEWKWYKAGTVRIDNLVTEIRLRDLTGFDARCDAIFFSKSAEENLPNGFLL